MALAAAGATFLLAANQKNLSEILVQNSRPPQGEPGKAPSTTVAPETFGVTVYKKTTLKARTR